MRARQQGVPFTITVEDVRAIYPADGRCPALGVRLTKGTGVATARSPSLDRLQPSWGYVPGNCAVISMAANRAKNNLRARDLDAVARWMRAQGLD